MAMETISTQIMSDKKLVFEAPVDVAFGWEKSPKTTRLPILAALWTLVESAVRECRVPLTLLLLLLMLPASVAGGVFAMASCCCSPFTKFVRWACHRWAESALVVAVVFTAFFSCDILLNLNSLGGSNTSSVAVAAVTGVERPSVANVTQPVKRCLAASSSDLEGEREGVREEGTKGEREGEREEEGGGERREIEG